MYSLIKNQTFSPDWAALGLERAELAETGRKHGFREQRVVLYCLYVQLLLTKVVSSYNFEVWPKVKLSANWLGLGLIRAK